SGRLRQVTATTIATCSALSFTPSEVTAAARAASLSSRKARQLIFAAWPAAGAPADVVADRGAEVFVAGPAPGAEGSGVAADRSALVDVARDVDAAEDAGADEEI